MVFQPFRYASCAQGGRRTRCEHKANMCVVNSIVKGVIDKAWYNIYKR